MDIKEALTAAFEQHEGGTSETPSAPAETSTPEPSQTQTVDTTPAVESAAAARARDEKGRFAPGSEPPAAPPSPEAPPVVTRKPPSSWKKDYHDDFYKARPEFQDYLDQREREQLAGISQYRTKAEALGAIEQAIAPFRPTLQQHGIREDQWISSLGQAHMTLVQGSPAQKLAMFAKLAKDYAVPVEHISNPEVWNQVQPREDPRAIVREEWMQIQTQEKFQQFLAEVQEGKYPHYEAVREDMYGLLQTSRAKDYPSAYRLAVRLNDELFESELHQKEQARQEAAKQAALKAKAAAVSVRTSAPTGATGADAGKSKDVRSTVAAAWGAHEGERV